MTCIVGLIDSGKVYIGADSAGVGGLDIKLRKDVKAFKNDEFLIGFTTSFRMGQLLQYSFSPPKIYELDLFHYMVTLFVDAVRNCFKNGGYASKNNEAEIGGTFLIGVRGRLFKIESDYQVSEVYDDFDSCGCGESYAIGALEVLKDSTLTAKQKIIKSLEVAEKFSAGVSAPFNVVEI